MDDRGDLLDLGHATHRCHLAPGGEPFGIVDAVAREFGLDIAALRAWDRSVLTPSGAAWIDRDVGGEAACG